MKKLILSLIAGLLILGSTYSIYFFPIKKPEPGTKVIIIGGTSGIGEAMAYEFAKRDYIVGITGRRVALLKEITAKIGKNIYNKPMDVTKPEEAQKALQELIKDMGGMDIIVINAGVSSQSLAWNDQKNIIDTNILGFTAMAASATKYFKNKGSGHIVGISSITGLRGSGFAPTYAASKAYISNYLEGLRMRFVKNNIPIIVTDIQPGLIDTALVRHIKFPIRDTPQEAAKQIADAVERHDEQAYVTKRWRVLAWVNKFMPTWLLEQLIERVRQILA